MTPFDFLDAINTTKEDLFKDPQANKDYNAFIVNRGLSYYMDTIFFANEMNRYSFIDKDQQFNFLLNICNKKKKCYTKWAKKSVEDVDAICSYFGYSKRMANSVINTFTTEQLQMIRDKYDKGGK